MKADNSNIGKNGSGCSDPTAYAAIKKLGHDGKLKDRHRGKDVEDMIHIIRRTCEMMDFEIDGHLTLIDKQTGRVYK